MTETHTSLRVGERTAVTVEFVTRRTLDSGGTRVHRLLVEDQTGTRFPVLVDPNAGLLAGLKTGETYQFTGLLGSQPHTTEQADDACPDCGAALREGTVADAIDDALATVADRLGIDTTFGIIDEHTTVSRAQRSGGPVDDWQPMDAQRERTTGPDYVCPACAKQLDAYELRGGTTNEGVPAANIQASIEHTNAAASPETVGLAAGGDTDTTNFRENVEAGYTPQPDAISDEGLFYDYYFETGDSNAGPRDALFSPRYAGAASEHPLTGETERFLSVGLDSTLAVEDFQRPQLDLVAVLDVSGSMNSQFDAYYYDEHGQRRDVETDAATKLEAATQSLCALTEQLQPEDRLGVVLYNHRAHVAKPLRDVETTDMDAIRRHIKHIAAGGSTNMADGFEAAADLLADTTRHDDVERRVVFMTDMMPNTGTTGDTDLARLFADAADHGIHTTFVGMGIDENAGLADTLSGIRGANHYFVQSADEFERRLGDEFAYMVTPLVYDLSLELHGEGYDITAVHGSPSAGDATNRLMEVETLFPSAKQDGDARGGVILVQVEQTTPDAELELVASWSERDGTDHAERVTVDVPAEPDTYAHTGIRKAIALARYASELQDWTQTVHERATTTTGVDDWLLPDARGDHERESVPLVVPDEHADRFTRLRDYLANEQQAVTDDTLTRELDLLETLCAVQPTQPREVTD